MNLTLPKFDITFDQILNDSLINMGLQTAFDEDNADFTDLGTTKQDGNLYIGLVRQKANKKVQKPLQPRKLQWLKQPLWI